MTLGEVEDDVIDAGFVHVQDEEQRQLDELTEGGRAAFGTGDLSVCVVVQVAAEPALGLFVTLAVAVMTGPSPT
jgi:hypothetical protein